MKTLATLLFVLLAHASYGAEVSLCKNEALKAAFERYTYEFPESIVSIKTLGQAIIDGGEVYHSVQVIDMESSQKIIMGVILEKRSCRVIAVN